MITAADTNVLVDSIFSDVNFGAQSTEWLAAARQQGQLLVCDVVYAELVHGFVSRDALDEKLRELGALVSPIDADIAYLAGQRWAGYRRRGGPRRRILPDFLIGAHAARTAQTLLTRDDGFFAIHFPELAG